MKHGFIKVGAASPVIKVADTDFNAERIIECIKDAADKGVKVLVFPELSLTGCSCYDLISHKVLLEGAKEALVHVVSATEGIDMLSFVGLPFADGGKLYSCAAVIYNGELMGLVPAENCYDGPFTGSAVEEAKLVNIGKLETLLLRSDSLFTCDAVDGFTVAVELGADLDAVIPPSVWHAQAGATIIAQMASFPETVTSTGNAQLNARCQSKRLRCGLVMAAPGKGESTTDNVYSGLCMVSEDGEILAQSEGENSLAISEIDVEHMVNIRLEKGGFWDDNSHDEYLFGMEPVETQLTRTYSMYPHLPEKPEDMDDYCRRVLDIQVTALCKRMEYAGLDHCVVGISGGVDSTLCVMVCAMAVKKLGLPAENVVACTLPCFGTSSRTKSNAIVVAEQCGAEVRVIDIGKSVYQHFDDIGHAHDDYSIAFENAQARMRTMVLMDIANKVNGLDVGTEDLSEFIDGWCTYNGDHTSMYDVNMGLTKTQVRANVRFIAEHTEDKVLAAALWDVLDCPVTPELLPIHDDQIEQKSEDAVGSYSLQDFFTHKMLMCGFTPSKTFRLAKQAYGKQFTDEELLRWLKSYCKRLFSQQFKRSCLMDGPAVGSFSVSPRNGFLMPSDGENTLFVKEVEELEKEILA